MRPAAVRNRLAEGKLAERCSQPALSFLLNDRTQRCDPGGMVVQAWAAEKLLAASLVEDLLRFEADLVDGFQTVGREAGRRDEDPLDAAAGQAFERLVRIRPEPAFLAEERLKRLRPVRTRPAQPLDERARRPLDVRG